MRIEGSVTIVTGAGSGIGRALAESFAASGASVVVSDIDIDGARRTTDGITAAGHAAVVRHADASKPDGIRGLIDCAADNFGPVDIYVANAGVTGPPGLGLVEDDWDRTLEVNLKAHVRAAVMLVPDWVKRGAGCFVSIASAAGLLTQIGDAAYTVSKHAAVAFAEWLAVTYGDSGVHVTCACPMGVNTPLLNATLESSDTAHRLSARAIINAAAVVEPQLVADATLRAVREDRFLSLPQADARNLFQRKAADHDRWVLGMQRYQNSLGADVDRLTASHG
ncbi:SDR family NAD(P)-dependent oxidoreductase [Mycobacterium asiaticum]|uniref:Dehydrogenase n=1 Tax=Mycobacterium asiaticum TaxID=1790 RepID=A0A1A3MX14_MYCAS|nr:SDR family NAD(P)-dependent oxidoreductase [Mycobacterium asiaticum]OBK13334.1 dehydrogenase [Mycobacterium asiaticum]